MVILNNNSKDLFNTEQYKDCSNLLKADDPPLEEIDPAILSCGLPAIILSDVQQLYPIITRYSITQLLAIRKSALSYKRPAVADDPKVSRYAIWKEQKQLHRNCIQIPNTNRKDDKGDDMNTRMRSKDKVQERLANDKHQNYKENNFLAPRYRRNNEFVHRNHHVIVKSYKRDEFRLQDTVIEEEPEWVTSGPTSRLDTIELRGFDEDSKAGGLSASESSLEKIIGCHQNSNNSSTEKHISFYDDLHHYEHVHPKRGINLQKHDSSGRENDAESVTTCASSTGSPPPARSTPTKKVADFNNLEDEKPEDKEYKKHLQNSGININNFEEFMKFDSLLTTDSAPGGSSNNGSRFSKWFRRNNTTNQTTGLSYDARRSHLNENYHLGTNQNLRYQHDRQQQQHQRNAYNRGGYQTDALDANHYIPSNATVAYKQLMDILSQNRANNNLIAQQQYLCQLISKTQQSDFLRNMVMKTHVDCCDDNSKLEPKSSPHRIPTHRELQYHTQTIMQNALLRKKIQDTQKLLAEQSSQLAAATRAAEPNPIVQQFVQSVSPNMQRSLSVLSQTATSASQCRQFNNSYSMDASRNMSNSSLFAGGPTQYDLQLQQMIPPHRSTSGANNRRFGKASLSWN